MSPPGATLLDVTWGVAGGGVSIGLEVGNIRLTQEDHNHGQIQNGHNKDLSNICAYTNIEYVTSSKKSALSPTTGRVVCDYISDWIRA